MDNITAICKICNNSAQADKFKLHHEYKRMVCPNCFSGKTQYIKDKDKKKEESSKPLGWDKEDEYLEKITRIKEINAKPEFKKIPGTNQVKCTCHNCKFSFKYDPFRKSPRTCPYCNGDIPKLRTFNLL